MRAMACFWIGAKVIFYPIGSVRNCNFARYAAASIDFDATLPDLVLCAGGPGDPIVIPGFADRYLEGELVSVLLQGGPIVVSDHTLWYGL